MKNSDIVELSLDLNTAITPKDSNLTLDELKVEPLGHSLQLLLSYLPPLGGEAGPWIAGSAVRKCIHRDECRRFKDKEEHQTELEAIGLNDVDIFFSSIEQLNAYRAALHHMYDKNIRETDMGEELNPFEYAEACNVEDYTIFTGDGDIRVQLILIYFYDSLVNLLNSFDFTICQFATNGQFQYSTWRGCHDAGAGELAIHKINNPRSTVWRLAKYAKQGFRVSLQCIDKILDSGQKQKDDIL